MDNGYLLATSLLGECSFVSTISLHLVHDGDVRKDKSHIFFSDVTISVEVITKME